MFAGEFILITKEAYKLQREEGAFLSLHTYTQEGGEVLTFTKANFLQFLILAQYFPTHCNEQAGWMEDLVGWLNMNDMEISNIFTLIF